MALLLETTLGDVAIDLDIQGSPELCRNVLKLAKARYYTNVLFFNVQPNRFCQTGDPCGDGSGGACIYGVMDAANKKNSDLRHNPKRFLKSHGRVLTSNERQEKGRVVATELNGIPDTIGSQFLLTLVEGPDRALDGYRVSTTRTSRAEDVNSGNDGPPRYYSLGVVTEDDQNVLDQIHNAYCDSQGRPYADVRIVRALVLHDPFDDPPGMDDLLQSRGVEVDQLGNGRKVTASPNYPRPPEERVEVRISADQVETDEDEELDEQAARERDERIRRKEDQSRANVLEMLGDLPSAEIKAPENVLFICKLNSITDDEDLELIFSRFDPNVKVEIIRDTDTGASLQYAFAEFTNKDQCVEAYFKMNNALIDDRRIKVDFSQSVAKIWDRYAQRMRGDPTAGQGRYNASSGGPGRGRGHVRADRGPGGQGPGQNFSRQPARESRSREYRNGGRPANINGHSEDKGLSLDERDQNRRLSPNRNANPHANRHGRRRSPERAEGHRHHHGDQERRRRSTSASSDSREEGRRRKDHHERRRHKNERRDRHDAERRSHRDDDRGSKDGARRSIGDKRDRKGHRDEHRRHKRTDEDRKRRLKHEHRNEREERYIDDDGRKRRHRKRHRRSHSRSPMSHSSHN